MSRTAELYLDLLTRTLARDSSAPLTAPPFRPFDRHTPRLQRSLKWKLISPILNRLERQGVVLARMPAVVETAPVLGESAVGLARLRHLARCVRQVVSDDVPGDLVDAGRWAGGAAVLMRGALEAYNDPARRVWLVDAERSSPPVPSEDDELPSAAEFQAFQALLADADAVRADFHRYGLFDESP